MTNPAVNFYNIFPKLEAMGLTMAQEIGKSSVMEAFVYLIFVWGLFEVFFRVYKTRDFMPFVNYIVYFAIMMALFFGSPSVKSPFNYISFPTMVADSFTNGIINVLSNKQTQDALNADFDKLDTQLLRSGPGNKVIPDASTPQTYKDQYALIQNNLKSISADCHISDPTQIIKNNVPTNTYTGTLVPTSYYTTEYTSLGGQPQSVSCQKAVSNVRSEMSDYINYWKGTPIGQKIYIGHDYSANLTGKDYNVALFLGGGNISNVALGTVVANSNTGGISSNNHGVSFVVTMFINQILESLGSIIVEFLAVGTTMMAPLMMYAMFMFNALFYSLIILVTPIVFVLAMQKPENIIMYVKWIFTIIWARSWEIIIFVLINIYNPINFTGGPGGVGVVNSSLILNDLWTISIITVTALAPGIMALVLLEGRGMITSAMVGIAGGLTMERAVEKLEGYISGLTALGTGKLGGGGKGKGIDKGVTK